MYVYCNFITFIVYYFILIIIDLYLLFHVCWLQIRDLSNDIF